MNKEELLKKFKETNKGLQKVILKRKKWKERYYKKKQENKELKEAIVKIKYELKQYKTDLKSYQEQDTLNHQNISIGLVGVKIRIIEDILKEVE